MNFTPNGFLRAAKNGISFPTKISSSEKFLVCIALQLIPGYCSLSTSF